MMVPRKLLTHGAMIRLEEEEDGGAGVILMEIDSYYDRQGKMESVRDRIPITFFFPNYGPSGWKPGQPAWVHFELYADWDDVTKISSKEKWIKPFGNARTRYRYSLAGEMFQLDEPGHDEDLYVNPGFPISMTLGMPPYPKKPGPVVEGQYVRVSKGDLFGHLSQWRSDRAPG